MIELKELKAYYNNVYYHPDKKPSRNLNDYKVFLDYLHPFKKSKLLDISCGTGLLLKAAKKFYECQTFGIDLSKNAILKAKINSKSKNLQLANGEALPYKDNSFDYITNIGSLEHYLDPDKGLQEIIRICKPEGKICIVLPNYYYLLNILYAFLKVEHFTGHYQINEKVDTLKGWLGFLNRSDLTVEKIYQDKGPKQPSVFIDPNPLKIAKRIFKKFLLAVTPLHLTYQFVFICKKSISE